MYGPGLPLPSAAFIATNAPPRVTGGRRERTIAVEVDAAAGWPYAMASGGIGESIVDPLVSTICSPLGPAGIIWKGARGIACEDIVTVENDDARDVEAE